MTSIAVYNAKAGVGCTSLVYHLAWMYARLGLRVIVVDCDPQCDLSGYLLGFDALPLVEGDDEIGASVVQALIHPSTGPRNMITELTPGLGLVRGSPEFEEHVAESTDAYGLCFSGARSAIPEDLGSARLRRLVVALQEHCELVVLDAGAGLGLAPCLATCAADYVLWALAPDGMAAEGLALGARALGRWRSRWQAYIDRLLAPETLARFAREREECARCGLAPAETLAAADAVWLGRGPRDLGLVRTGASDYFGMSSSHVASASERQLQYQGLARIYKAYLSDELSSLAELTPWVGLREESLHLRKPMFELTPADGIHGSASFAVRRCATEYEKLARAIAERIGLELP